MLRALICRDVYKRQKYSSLLEQTIGGIYVSYSVGIIQDNRPSLCRMNWRAAKRKEQLRRPQNKNGKGICLTTRICTIMQFKIVIINNEFRTAFSLYLNGSVFLLHCSSFQSESCPVYCFWDIIDRVTTVFTNEPSPRCLV